MSTVLYGGVRYVPVLSGSFYDSRAAEVGIAIAISVGVGSDLQITHWVVGGVFYCTETIGLSIAS